MNENGDDAPTQQFEETTLGHTAPAELPDASPRALTGAAWLREGLRAGVFMAPRIRARGPSPLQFLLVAVLVSLLFIAGGRLEIAGPAHFDQLAWLGSWWQSGAMLLVMWCVLAVRRTEVAADGPAEGAGLAAWFTLWVGATVPVGLVSLLLGMAQARGLLPEILETSEWLAWALYWLLFCWGLGSALRLAARFAPDRLRVVAACFLIGAVYGFSMSLGPQRWWYADEPVAAADKPRLHLTQETFQAQEALFQKTVDGIVPQRPGTTDVYGLVFAPYAREDVFMRESAMVASVLEQRFDASGRVVQLVNNPATAERLPWATPLNLRRAIDALAQRMDRENDVLVVYLTSHGASDFQLAASHWPLEVDPLTPALLRQMLDKAGIRNRVIAVSACYSGGWVDPLAGESTLVMTAADATHTSYGCGSLSPLTYFGRGVWDEQLRRTHSFEQAFDGAVPLIRQREIDGKKKDGFSNPQIRVGARIRPLLDELAKSLDGKSR